MRYLIKRILAFILVITFILPMLQNIYATDAIIISEQIENGTEESPYLINNPEDLKNIINNLSGNYKLTNDIDLSQIDWEPLNTFSGVLDGNGYTIKNLTINKSDKNYIGIFKKLLNATVKNINFDNVDVKGNLDVGIITGETSNCQISNISVKNSIINGYDSVGSLVGTFKNSKISDINISKDVQVNGNQQIGGLFGVIFVSDIERCSVSAKVSAISMAGGFAGSTTGASSENIITIKNSVVDGEITTPKGTVGGFIGYSNGQPVTIENSISYSTCKGLFTNGFMGNISLINNLTLINAFFDSSLYENLITSNSDYASLRTTEQLKDKSTYINWDFENIWTIDNNYPYLNKYENSDENNNDANIIIDTSAFLEVGDNEYIISDNIQKINIEVTGNFTPKVINYEIKYGEYTIQTDQVEQDKVFDIINPVLLEGRNTLSVTAIDSSDEKINKMIIIYSANEENENGYSKDNSDNDGDNLLNYQEDYYGTDKNNKDTDGDGLTDYYEINESGTDPLNSDINNNGVLDGDDDFDNDGLTNKEENHYGTNPYAKDSDLDGLTDKEEISLKTNPVLPDTDEDGIDDFFEINDSKTDPLNPDTNGNGILDGDEKYNFIYISDDAYEHDTVTASVKMNILPEEYKTLSVTRVSEHDPFLSNNIPGFIGNAYEFNVESEFDEAEIQFTYKLSEQVLNEFDPKIYYYNEELSTLEELPNQTIDGNKISAKVNHFSSYLLLNKPDFEKAFENAFEYDMTQGVVESPKEIIFLLDFRGFSNNRLLKGLSVLLTKNIVEQINNGHKIKIVSIKNNIFIEELEFTNNKNLVTSTLNTLSDVEYLGSTSLPQMLNNAVNSFDNTSPAKDNNQKQLIVFTDGESYTNLLPSTIKDYNTAINNAKKNNINISIVHTSKTSNGEMVGIAEEANGLYIAVPSFSDYAINSCVTKILDRINEFDIVMAPINSELDKDEDGIWDYYEKNGMLLGNGQRIYSDPNSNDSDDDGLLDGQEVFMNLSSDGKKVEGFQFKTNPILSDTDWDGYSDNEELRIHKSNPLKRNMIYKYDDIDFLTDDDYYFAMRVREAYDNLVFKGLVELGNNVYGNNYSKKYMHEKSLIDLIELINEQTEEREKSEKFDTLLDWGASLSNSYQALVDLKAIDIDELDKLRKSICNYSNLLRHHKNYLETFDSIELSSAADLINENITELLPKYFEVQKIVDKNLFITPKNIKNFKIFKKISSNGITIATFGSEALKSFNDVSKMMSNIKTIEDNVYILEKIAHNASDNNVKSAATSLYNLAIDESNDFIFEIFNINLGQEIGGVVKSEVVEKVIAKSNPKAFLISLTISLTDFATNVSDMTELAYRTFGIGIMSEALKEELLQKIQNKSYIASGKDGYICYDNTIDNIYEQVNGLANLRILGEKSSINLQDAPRDWLKKFNDLTTFGDTSEQIKNACETMITLAKDIQKSIYN